MNKHMLFKVLVVVWLAGLTAYLVYRDTREVEEPLTMAQYVEEKTEVDRILEMYRIALKELTREYLKRWNPEEEADSQP